MNETYIVENSLGRKILVINQYIDLAHADDIKTDDFDIVFINVEGLSFNRLRQLFHNSSPFHVQKCWMKPRFLSLTLRDNVGMLRYLVDGFANTPLDDSVTRAAENIFEQMRTLQIAPMVYGYDTESTFFIRLCKYCLVRRYYTFPLTAVPSLINGLSSVFAALVDNHENVMGDMTFDAKAFMEFTQKMLNTGYVESKGILERTHVCPQCQSSFLLFMESCPKCNSSDIQEVPMIHHFRCANISPESTYVYDDQLRCPKCRHFLRHIGVDYDRPTNSYVCNKCGNTFLRSNMKVLCADCGKLYTPDELFPYNIYEYEFTQTGIRAIASNEAVVSFNRTLWAGYTTFDAYLSKLRLFVIIDSDGAVLRTLRVRIASDAPIGIAERTAMLQQMHALFEDCSISYKGNYYFLSLRANPTLAEKEIEQYFDDRLLQFRRRWPSIHVDKGVLFSADGEDIESYITRLCRFNELN